MTDGPPKNCPIVSICDDQRPGILVFHRTSIQHNGSHCSPQLINPNRIPTKIQTGARAVLRHDQCEFDDYRLQNVQIFICEIEQLRLH